MGLWSEWHYTMREIGGWIHIICIHTPIPELCDAIQITSQMPFSLLYHTLWCKFKHQHISLKFIHNVTLIWLPAAGFIWRWLLWCFESHARLAVAHAAIFIVCDVFQIRERHHAQIKNEIMDGYQGDHVTFVWSWCQSKQRLSFCCTFYPFIQHHDAHVLHRRTLWSPDVTLLGHTIAHLQISRFHTQVWYKTFYNMHHYLMTIIIKFSIWLSNIDFHLRKIVMISIQLGR